jgi:hypothetical protein
VLAFVRLPPVDKLGHAPDAEVNVVSAPGECRGYHRTARCHWRGWGTRSLEGIMATEVQTQAGREIPGMGFPFIYFAVARALAKRKPFCCPECGRPVAA